MNEIAIRSAATADVPAIVALWRESLALHGDRDPSFRPRADGHLVFERFVRERIGSPEAAILVAERGGELAAYGICVLRTRPDFFEPVLHGLVTDLDVSARHRRLGLGERLLEALSAWLRGRGIQRMEAEVVAANELAAAFWRKQGFATYYQAMSRDV
jgi:ribosomal protein S18 acetylase RimI-like enzyme